jgi:NAD dependent epimerase/dehydratase family enzyme
MSWIARADVAELVLRALTDPAMRGAYNAVAGAVTNAEFTRTLGRVLHRPTLLPVPVPALDLLFGTEMVRATLLASQRADPARLRELGHRFLYPELEGALRAALED